MTIKKTILLIVCFFITGVFLGICFSNNRKYNEGYSAGNNAGYSRGQTQGHNKGRTAGYNQARDEFQKQIDELQRRITTIERNHRNKITAIETEHRSRIAAMEAKHRSEITNSYNKGFNAGTVAMEEKILTQIEIGSQQRIGNNRRNEPMFGIKRQ
jgi:flagellar biosynthesis/type III secretory pathway protein FliH